MTDQAAVAAVVVGWNRFDDTRRCLELLHASESPQSVVLVDNGSSDGSPERLSLLFPDAQIVRSPRNLGFAGGANLGIREALRSGAAFVWLLNNDAEAEPGTSQALVAEAERDTRVGVVGGVIYGRGGRIHTWGGGTIGWTGVARLAAGPGPLDYVSGACMLLRRGLLEELGGFDERFFFYYEDADLCRRARAAGWRLAVAPAARVVHTVGASVGGGPEKRSERADLLQAEAGGVYLGKHRGRLAWPAASLRLAGIAANRLARGQPARIVPLCAALVRGVRKGRAPVGRFRSAPD